MVIINSREDQARRIGYLYAAALLILAVVLRLVSAPPSTMLPLMIGAAGIALYSIYSVPRKGDGGRVFYQANYKKLSQEMDLRAIGPAVLKGWTQSRNVMGALLLTGGELQFRAITETGIPEESMLQIDLFSFADVAIGKRDTFSIVTEEGKSYTFMVNKPKVWQSQIYKTRR